MTPETSLQPGDKITRTRRQHIGLKGELTLALLPTLVILTVLGLVEVFSRQRLLFASLASSAFLIYLDPQHGMNTIRTIVTAHMSAALTGFGLYVLLGPGYLAGGSAMVATIVLMILFDAVHPPAVSTALSFAFRTPPEQSLALFGMALALIAVLIVLERTSLWLLTRFNQRS